jgi:hypothetical protein
MPGAPDSLWIVVANLALAALVLVPVATLVGSGLAALLRRPDRRVRRILVPGIGRLLVLEE